MLGYCATAINLSLGCSRRDEQVQYDILVEECAGSSMQSPVVDLVSKVTTAAPPPTL